MRKVKSAISYYTNKRISLKNIHKGDVWLVKYPFEQPGNYFKIRPALVVDYGENKIVVRYITTNPNRGVEINYTGAYKDRKSYLEKKYAKLLPDELIRKIGRVIYENNTREDIN